MKQFTCKQDLDDLEISYPVRTLVEHVLAAELSISKSDILSSDDGAVYLIEEDDDDQSIISVIGSPLSRSLFEGVKYNAASRCFTCLLLRDNQCCLTLIIPNSEWLREEWKFVLEQEVTS